MKEISKKILYDTPLLNKNRLKIALSYHNFFYDLVKISSTKKELIVLGLMRSGNHAVINWVANQSPGLVSFCNDLKPGLSPKSAIQRQTRLNSIKQAFTHKTLIYSYEDYEPKAIFPPEFVTRKAHYVGKSAIATAVLILRDPYNLFASRLLWNRHAGEWFREKPEYRNHILKLWKAHAKEFLGETNFLGKNKLSINYNKWVEEIEYRQSIACSLDISFSDKGMEETPEYGGGSSFGEIQATSTMQRWQKVSNSEYRSIYQELIDDNELKYLSDEIFGDQLSQMVFDEFF